VNIQCEVGAQYLSPFVASRKQISVTSVTLIACRPLMPQTDLTAAGRSQKASGQHSVSGSAFTESAGYEYPSVLQPPCHIPPTLCRSSSLITNSMPILMKFHSYRPTNITIIGTGINGRESILRLRVGAQSRPPWLGAQLLTRNSRTHLG
jgi:hypothetical protein